MDKRDLKIKYMLILSPIVDLLTGILKNEYDMMLSPSAIYRGLLFVFFSYCLFFKMPQRRNRRHNIIKYYIVIYVVIFLISRFMYYHFKIFLFEIFYLTRYLIFPVFYLVFENYVNKTSVEEIAKYVRLSGLIYALMVIFPFIAGNSFKSYNLSGLAGEVGFFHGANEIGSILGITLFYYDSNFFINYKSNMQDKKSTRMLLGIIIIILAILITGTKLSLILLMFYLLTTLIKLYINLSGTRKYFIIGIIMTGLLIAFVFSPAFSNLKLILKNSQNIIGSLLSGRTVYFIQNFNVFKSARFVQKIIGIGMYRLDLNGVPFLIKLSEMDFFDVGIIYGIISIPLFYYPYISYFIENKLDCYRINQCNISLNKQLHLVSILSFVWSFLIGHVLGSPSVSIFIVITLVLSNYKNVNKLS